MCRAVTLPSPERARLARILATIEIPDCQCLKVPEPCRHKRKDPETVCDCPEFVPPCPHVLTAAQHVLSIDAWAELLLGLYPKEYLAAQRPDGAFLCYTREARVAVLENRLHHGLSLWNRRDITFMPEAMDDIGKQFATRNGRRLFNGADDPHEKILPGRQPCQPPRKS